MIADPAKYLIPKTLDAPKMILFFESDTVIIFALFPMIGFMSNSIQILLLMIAIGVGVAHKYAQIKSGGGIGLILRVLTWYTPSNMWIKSKVKSYIREYIG